MTGAGVIAAACVAAALLLALPARPPFPGRGRSPALRPAGPATLALTVVAAAALTRLDGVRLALALVVLGALVGLGGLARRRRRQRRSAEVQGRVVELSEALVGELRAGRPVIDALQRGGSLWPPFAPVAGAARLGADVPAALRHLAAVPGAEGLSRLAGAWQVSERTGCSLVGVLEQVAASVRAEHSSARAVRAELASAQSTARLVAALPVATLAMGSGSGSSPWRFLLDTPVGLACLALGVGLMLLGLWWIDRIATTAQTSGGP